MRLEWLEDIIAVAETGSFNAAADRRFVTQPAFSRRIRAIEDYVGSELFDREHKPVRMKPLISDHQEEIRHLVKQLKDLRNELRRQGSETHNRIIIASQHALTATLAPAIVDMLSKRMEVSVRLRSANRDECYALLMARQADLVINYQSETEAAAGTDDFLECASLGTELFIPVYSAVRLEQTRDFESAGEIPVVAYPSDVFLGQIFEDEILPHLSGTGFVRRKVETALSLAALQFAINGNGIAWVPESVAREPVRSGTLRDLRDKLPSTVLAITAMRLAGARADALRVVWEEILTDFAENRLSNGTIPTVP